MKIQILTFIILICAGCVARVAVDAKTTARGVVAKDEAIASAAGRIKDNNDASPDSPQKPLIAADVDVIEAALAKLPASEVAKALASLAAERDAAKKEAALWKQKFHDAVDGVWRQVQFIGSLCLYGVAITGLVMAAFRAKAAVASGLAVMDGIRSTVTLVTLSATCFTVARFMASWWFWWACGTIVAAGVLYFGYLAIRERRGTAAANALTPIRKVLDRLYDEAAPEVKADLDRTLFDPLSEEMKKTPGAKTYIHLDRAAG